LNRSSSLDLSAGWAINNVFSVDKKRSGTGPVWSKRDETGSFICVISQNCRLDIWSAHKRLSGDGTNNICYETPQGPIRTIGNAVTLSPYGVNPIDGFVPLMA
jgi:hypothetical protein